MAEEDEKGTNLTGLAFLCRWSYACHTPQAMANGTSRIDLANIYKSRRLLCNARSKLTFAHHGEMFALATVIRSGGSLELLESQVVGASVDPARG